MFGIDKIGERPRKQNRSCGEGNVERSTPIAHPARLEFRLRSECVIIPLHAAGIEEYFMPEIHRDPGPKGAMAGETWMVRHPLAPKIVQVAWGVASPKR